MSDPTRSRRDFLAGLLTRAATGWVALGTGAVGAFLARCIPPAKYGGPPEPPPRPDPPPRDPGDEPRTVKYGGPRPDPDPGAAKYGGPPEPPPRAKQSRPQPVDKYGGPPEPPPRRQQVKYGGPSLRKYGGPRVTPAPAPGPVTKYGGPGRYAEDRDE